VCGIAGFKGNWDIADLRSMQALLRHRGPNDATLFEDHENRVGLAHTRLSIIDLSSGRQPLTNEDGSVVVIFNGEIYNHQSLRRELLARGHHLACGSDGEVIAHLYEDHGISFVERLRGMFAIALWDSRKKKLFLIRDRLGEKPIYFRQSSKGFLFASEIKAMLAVDRVREIDPQALEWFLSFRYVPEDRTLFSGISKLMPGHWLEFSDGQVKVQRYWSLKDQVPGSVDDEKTWVEELRHRLREAVQIQLMSEVPLGAFLSGGLDSSFLVALMASLNDRPVETFSFGVGTGWHDETQYAELAARALNTNHHPLSGDCDDLDLLRKVVWHLDEPLADTATVPTYQLASLASRHVTVALSGEGADELLGGYDKYKLLSYGQRLGPLVPRVPGNLIAKLMQGWTKPHRALRFLAQSYDQPQAYMELVGVYNDAERQRALSPVLAQQLRDQEPAAEVVRRIFHECQGLSYLDTIFHVDIDTWLPNDILLKADKMTMAHGLEARVPFLDHEFAEFCARMPASLKLRHWQEKYVLRKAMRGMVPEAIVNRRKHGFTVSLKSWLDGPLRTVLDDGRLRARGWFNPEWVAQRMQGDLNDPFVRRQVFAIVALELWAETFLDPSDSEISAGFPGGSAGSDA
jgi:asparagine synthase (glutamine-hydrolysing)